MVFGAIVPGRSSPFIRHLPVLGYYAERFFQKS